MDVAVTPNTQKKRMRRATTPNWRKLQANLSNVEEKVASLGRLVGSSFKAAETVKVAPPPVPGAPALPKNKYPIGSDPRAAHIDQQAQLAPADRTLLPSKVPPPAMDFGQTIQDWRQKLSPYKYPIIAGVGGWLAKDLYDTVTGRNEKEKQGGCSGKKSSKPRPYKFVHSESGTRKKMASTIVQAYIADIVRANLADGEKRAAAYGMYKLILALDSDASLTSSISSVYPEKSAQTVEKMAKTLIHKAYAAYARKTK